MARPREGDKDRALVDAAIELFLERGVRGTTIQDIAARAGVAVGTVYVYYKNKAAIVRSVAYAFADRHHEFAQGVLASRRRPLVKLNDYILGFYDMWRPFGENSRGALEIAESVLKHAPDTLSIAESEFQGTIQKILKEAKDAGLRVGRRPAEEARWIALSTAAFFPMSGTPKIRLLTSELTREDLEGLLNWIGKKLE